MNKYFFIAVVVLGLGGYLWMSKNSSVPTAFAGAQHDVTLDRLTNDVQEVNHQNDIILEDEIALDLFEEEDVTPATVLNEEIVVDVDKFKRKIDSNSKGHDVLEIPSLDTIESEIVLNNLAIEPSSSLVVEEKSIGTENEIFVG